MSLFSKIKKGLRYIGQSFAPVTKVYPQISLLAPNELLKGRVALITGGTSGIGFEIAKAFVNAGATVVITGRKQERLDKATSLLREEFNNTTCAFGLVMDMTNPDCFRDKITEALELLKAPIDILVNNAGVNGCSFGNGTEKDYDLVLDTNLKGAFFLSQELAHYMVKNKLQGNILNVASSSSLRPAVSAYGLSKWGIVGLTQGLARVLTEHGITVNAIAPGPTATPMQGLEKGDDISLSANLTGRFALPEEIANIAVILVSNMSRMIVGDVVYMTGGSGNIYNGDI